MISTSDLQAFLEKIDGQSGVDLVKIGQTFGQPQGNASNRNARKFRVALDIEGCVDRFYGGYFSDWACGGQFNRCFQFVQLLAHAFTAAQMEVIVFFDGTLKENKKLQLDRNDFRQRTISVLKHIRMIVTPPPKIWWLPPSGLRTCLRNALRTCNIPVVQTIHDHTMEVIDYYHEHKLNAIIGLHPDYIICNVSRYFSSHDLRLSYKGALETKEYMVHQVLTSLNLSSEQLAIIAVLLGGYILIDDAMLRKIYLKLNIEYNLDFEARIRKVADLVRPIPPNSAVDAAIKQLDLTEFTDVLKESIEYYQRKGIFGGKRYLGSKKKPITEIIKNIDVVQDAPALPMASEKNEKNEKSENDEIANKIINDVEKLVNENEPTIIATAPGTEIVRKCVKFVYSLPAEVLRTSYQRHQRGNMDPRIYILLTKKEILMPQVLEDEQYREMPPIHIFYRPARQMIYAVLFNLYHQKYMCSKNKDNLPSPEVTISEWIWSPQNEYKKPDKVNAIQLPWAVPTIQRLWFGTTYDDKHRRMRAFLTVMRSDSPLMLNRNYVPQHMIVLACVLRYIVTNLDRNVLTRQELDAFLVTAFSPQLMNVEYTQEMVLPGVYLRGVFLATLLMQGVETAQLANDACGVPLPWSMTNPWLFFDGKLFHLKLKMAVCLQNIRELCDDQLEVVMKIERFRKAILEDIENLVPAHIADAIYRPSMYPPTAQYASSYGKNMGYLVQNGYGYGPAASLHQQQQLYFNQNVNGYGRTAGKGGHPIQQIQKGGQRGVYQKSGYQLKVGGVVVGSWANGSNRPGAQGGHRVNRTGMPVRLPIYRNRTTNNRMRVTSNYSSIMPGSGGVNGGLPRTRFVSVKNKKNKTKKESTKAKIATKVGDVVEKKILKDKKSDDNTDGSEDAPDESNNTTNDNETEIIVENGQKKEDRSEKCDDELNNKDASDDAPISTDDSTDVACEKTTNAVNSNSTTQINKQNGGGKNNKKNKKKNNSSNNAKASPLESPQIDVATVEAVTDEDKETVQGEIKV